MLEKLEDSLSCLICKELIDVAELAACDHVFCSVCIRRHLKQDQNCPVCRKEVHAGGLRRLRVLDGVVEEYKRSRAHFMTKHDEPKRQRKDSTPIAASKYPSADKSSPEERSNGPQLAECPVCLQQLPIQEIQGSHIVNCLKPKPDLKRRALVNYSLKKDKDIKTMLQKDGLSTEGSRTRLIARHSEWLLQWNANVSRTTPLPILELRQLMTRWEAAQQLNKQTKIDAETWADEQAEMYKDLQDAAFSQLGRPGPRKRTLSEIESDS